MTASTYQLFPPLEESAYEALKADIATRGVMVPVEMDDAGNILDGHHRVQACDELGLTYPKVTRTLNSHEAKVDHVLKLNLLRRHLGPISWAEAFEQLCEVRGVELGQESSAAKRWSQSDTVSDVAAELGVNPRTARRRVETLHKLAERPDLAEQVERGDMPAKRAVKLARQDSEPVHAVPATYLPAGTFSGWVHGFSMYARSTGLRGDQN